MCARVSRIFNWSIFKFASKEERTVISVYNVAYLALFRNIENKWCTFCFFFRRSQIISSWNCIFNRDCVMAGNVQPHQNYIDRYLHSSAIKLCYFWCERCECARNKRLSDAINREIDVISKCQLIKLLLFCVRFDCWHRKIMQHWISIVFAENEWKKLMALSIHMRSHIQKQKFYHFKWIISIWWSWSRLIDIERISNHYQVVFRIRQCFYFFPCNIINCVFSSLELLLWRMWWYHQFKLYTNMCVLSR